MPKVNYCPLIGLSILSVLVALPVHAVFLKSNQCVGVIASVDGYANIRERPTTASKIRGTLKKGTNIDVHEVMKRESRYWYRVRRGYIRANQIRRECAGSVGRPDFPYP